MQASVIRWAKLVSIGLVASGVDFLLLVGMDAIKIPLWLAANAAYFAGVTAVYIMSRVWIVDRANSPPSRLEIFLFFSAGGLGAILNYLLLATTTGFIGLESAKLVSLVVVFFINNVMRAWVFRVAADRHNRSVTG